MMDSQPPPYSDTKGPIPPDQQPGGYPQQPGGYPQQPGGYPQQPAGYPQQPAGNPQQPAGYPQQPGQPQMGYAQPQPGSNTVIVTQPQTVTTVIQQTRFGPNSMATTCSSCSHQVNTTTKSQCCSSMPWLICGVICLVGLFLGGITWLGCCLIPFCIPDLYDVEHSCPNCHTVVGYYRRMGT